MTWNSSAWTSTSSTGRSSVRTSLNCSIHAALSGQPSARASAKVMSKDRQDNRPMRQGRSHLPDRAPSGRHAPNLRDSNPAPRPAARSRTGTGHRVRRSRTLLHDRIEGTAPVFARMVHHDIDEHGHEKGQDRGAITHLIPVDPAVPGRAAVDELVAKDVEPVEHEAQDLDGIPRPKGSRESTLRGPESFLSVFVPADTVVVLPERVEHKAVVQKHADGPREVVPYGVVYPLTGIQSHYLPEVAGERGPFPGRRVVELLFIRIGRVEADPQEDEPSIVIGCVFGPSDPAKIGARAGPSFPEIRRAVPAAWPSGWRASGALVWNVRLLTAAGPAEAGHLSGTLAPAPREIQISRVATVLQLAKPECRAALEHEAVVVVQRTEGGNDVGQHVVPFRCKRAIWAVVAGLRSVSWRIVVVRAEIRPSVPVHRRAPPAE